MVRVVATGDCNGFVHTFGSGVAKGNGTRAFASLPPHVKTGAWLIGALPPSLGSRKYPPPLSCGLARRQGWSAVEKVDWILMFRFQAVPRKAGLYRWEPFHRAFFPCHLPETARGFGGRR